MSYTTGTNYRSIKNFSGGRGIVSKLRTSQTSNYNNIKTNSNLSSSEEDSSNNDILRVELKTYSKIAQNSASDIKKSGEKLVATKENSLFFIAEKTNNTKKVVSEATDFINSYNNMLSSIRKLGGTENKNFISQLKKYAEENSELLKNIGVTVLSDGSMTMNKNEMDEASLENLKKVFNGENSFADKVTTLSEDINKNVEEKLKENLIILGNTKSIFEDSSSSSTGSYFDFTI